MFSLVPTSAFFIRRRFGSLLLGVGLVYAEIFLALCIGVWAKTIPALIASVWGKMIPSFLKTRAKCLKTRLALVKWLRQS